MTARMSQSDNLNMIHDTDECPCEMCQWADKQERFEPSDDEAILNDIDVVLAKKQIQELPTVTTPIVSAQTEIDYYPVSRIRAAIFDVLDGGCTCSGPGEKHPWEVQDRIVNGQWVEVEYVTEQRVRFVDAVIARLEKG